MKCPDAETVLRAVIDCDEGIRGAQKRQAWLNGQDAAYLQELWDSARVLSEMCAAALAAQRGAAAVALTHEPAGQPGTPQ